MLSRRKFLKLTGLSVAAVGAGFSAGKLIGNKKSTHFAVYGLIPEDEQIIRNLILAFRNKVQSSAPPVVNSELKTSVFLKRIDLNVLNSSFADRGNIIYSLKRLNKAADADIIISDPENSVYDLKNFDSSMSGIRAILKNRKAEYLFTAEYAESDLLSSLFKSNKKELVIESINGLVDRIPLNKNYKNIPVKGPQGTTIAEIENGIARVNSACCRHKICTHSIAASPGSIIACAPNKILIKVELV